MKLLHRINLITLVSCIVGIATLAGSATQALGAVTTIVEIPYYSGTRGYPYNMPAVDLANFGYAEREFRIAGTGNLYAQANRWQSDGIWNIKVKRKNYAYNTRILVRQPTNPALFNGTVVVEWLNASTESDTDSDWGFAREEFMREGYAWVGVSAQRAGIGKLLAWDPVRYAALAPFQGNDGISYDMFTHVAQLIRSNPETIFNGLTPQRLIASGHSQSAHRMATYVNAIQPVSHAFDGFMIHGRTYTAASLGDGHYNHITTLIRADNAVPVFQLQSEYEIEGYFGRARQPDTAFLRTWEVAGAPHIDRHSGAYQSPIAFRDNGYLPLNCKKDGNRVPFHYAGEAAWSWLNRWVTDGTQPPQGDIIQTNSRNKAVRDAHRNALGGVRLPDMDVPIARYATRDNRGATGSTERDMALCPFVGSTTYFKSAKLRSLYSSHQDYVDRVEAAAADALQKGFILQQGYDDAVSRAQAANIP